MLVYPVSNFSAFFKRMYPYPMALYHYTPEELRRISKLANRWYSLYVVVAFFYILLLVAALSLALWGINSAIYALLPQGAKWFPQMVVLFAVPAVLIAIPLSFIGGLLTIRLFHRRDYKQILDLLYTRQGFDGIAGWLWSLKPLAICAVIAMWVVGHCYVSVSDNGFEIKNAGKFTAIHYNFSDISDITHYSYSMYQGKVVPFEHYSVLLSNGYYLKKLIPAIDNTQEMYKEIVARSHIKVYERGVDKY